MFVFIYMCIAALSQSLAFVTFFYTKNSMATNKARLMPNLLVILTLKFFDTP